MRQVSMMNEVMLVQMQKNVSYIVQILQQQITLRLILLKVIVKNDKLLFNNTTWLLKLSNNTTQK
jgi:hypothetical protein